MKKLVILPKKILKILLSLLITFTLGGTATAQQEVVHEHPCGTDEYINYMDQHDPEFKAKRVAEEQQIQQWIADHPEVNSRDVSTLITIPTVIHIVYKNNAENISVARCQTMIDRINQDFSRTNPDANQTPAVWQGIAANTGIELCLAQRTPSGGPTTGIERRQTNVTEFTLFSNDMKHYNTGGMDAWDVSKYLNIWVCDVQGSYSFVAGNGNNIGVVVYYGFAGNTTLKWSRIATHEVGHFFGLPHIWGNQSANTNCNNDDGVSDTPQQKKSSNQTNPNGSDDFYCPSFPQNSNTCAGTWPGAMFMNYMDYTSGTCQNLFTTGQKTKMLARLNGPYASLKTSDGCNPPGASVSAPPIPTVSSTNTCGPKTLTRGTPPSGITYYWQGTSCGTSTSNSSTTYSVSSSGTYYLRAKNANGVWSTTCSSIAITVNSIPGDPPVPAITTNPCGSQTLTRGVPPTGVTYYWQGTSCGTSINSSGLTKTITTSGTQYLRARTSAGCWSGCSSIAVVVNPLPTPSIAGQNSVCSNSNGVIYSVANSGNTFSWTINGGTIASGQNTNSISVNWGTAGSGTATITETNPSSNCSKTVSLNVNINASLNPTITASGSTSICQGQSVVLDASAGFSSYLWSNGDTTQTITVSNSGTFSVSVTSANGCSGSSSSPLTVTVNPNPSAIISPAGVITLCQGDSTILTAASAGIASYLWSNGETTQTILVSDSGTYSLVVTDTNGCSATSATKTVVLNQLPPTPSIAEFDGTLISSSSTGNQWYLSNVILPGDTSQNYTPTIASGDYTVKVTDGNGCSSTSVPYNYDVTGIEAIADEQVVSIYPNPATTIINISYNDRKASFLQIKLINIAGQLIYQENIDSFTGNYSKALDIKNEAEGVYFLQIITNTNSINKMVIKK